MSDAWKVILKGTNEAGEEVLLKVTEDGAIKTALPTSIESLLGTTNADIATIKDDIALIKADIADIKPESEKYVPVRIQTALAVAKHATAEYATLGVPIAAYSADKQIDLDIVVANEGSTGAYISMFIETSDDNSTWRRVCGSDGVGTKYLSAALFAKNATHRRSIPITIIGTYMRLVFVNLTGDGADADATITAEVKLKAVN